MIFPPLFRSEARVRFHRVLARVFLLALAFAAVAAVLPRQSTAQIIRPTPWTWQPSGGTYTADVTTASLSGTEIAQNVTLSLDAGLGGAEWSNAAVYACRWTSVVISDPNTFSVPTDTCREVVNNPGSTSNDYTMSYTPNSDEIAYGYVVFLFTSSGGPAYTEWIPFGGNPTGASITETDPSSLTKGTIDGATITVTLANTRYVASLGTGDFELASSPSGVSIDSVSRTSGTAAVLTLAGDYGDYEDLYEDGKISVRVLASGHTGSESLTTGETAVAAATLPETSFSEHPFLIVKKSMYPELRKRAEKEPWATIKRNAVIRFNRGYSPRSNFAHKNKDLSLFLSRAALVYILTEDETVRQGAVNAIVNAITGTFDGTTGITAQLNNQIHSRTVVPGGTFFNAVLAVDIIYDDMSSSQRTRVDNALQPVATFFINHPHFGVRNQPRWPLHVYGARLVWHLFKNNQVEANNAINGYIGVLNSQITEDGVFKEGTLYGTRRMAFTTYAKSYAMDVIAFTGKRNLYKEPRLISLYEWIYGYSRTPFGTFYSFGNSPPDIPDAASLNPNLDYLKWYPRAHSAGRFSPTAELNAAYAMRGRSQSSSTIDLPLLAYIFQDREPLVPRPPPSRIFQDGGAYFLEQTDSAEALAGAMNNVKTQYENHMHKDANAIHIAAYGENVLRNSGYYVNPTSTDLYRTVYNGAPTLAGCSTCTWPYINRTAKSSNVVTVDEMDYQDGTIHQGFKAGRGITEGFTGTAFDYASGRSGPGFSNGIHDRNFCFVHPSASANGYFLLFDEVFSGSGNDADLYLHPNSDDENVEVAKERYRWPVGSSTESNVRRTNNEVSVTVFLATPPDTATIADGLLAGRYNFQGRYLHATYAIEDRNARFTTVIFPHDRRHSRPDMTRIGVADRYTGARIDHSEDVVDFAVQPVAGKADETITDIDGKGVSVRGAAAWFRMRGDSVESFFLRRGKLFETGRFRFETEDPVSMLLEGNQGRIYAGGTGADLTIRWTATTDFNIYLNGRRQLLAVDGNNQIKMKIPAGNHQFEISARIQRQNAAAATPTTTTPGSVPRLVSSEVSGSDRKIVMLTYSVALDEESQPAAAAFKVQYQAAGETEEIGVDDVRVDGRTIRLTLASAIPAGASGLTVFYSAEDGGDAAVRSMDGGTEARDGSIEVTDSQGAGADVPEGGGCTLASSGSGAVGMETLLALILLVLGAVSTRATGKRS